MVTNPGMATTYHVLKEFTLGLYDHDLRNENVSPVPGITFRDTPSDKTILYEIFLKIEYNEIDFL